MKSTVKLFKALPVKVKRKKVISKELLKETLKRGFVFSPEVVANYSTEELNNFIPIIEEEIGLTPEKLTNTFHKSWEKVKTADMEQLIVEQIAHYLTTYGRETEKPEDYIEEKGEQWGVDNLGGKIIGLGDFESDKLKDENYIYIPAEKLEIPELKEGGINIVVIKGYTKEELKVKLMDMLSSGIALKEDTIKDVMEVGEFVGLDEKDIDNIKNKEVKITLYDKLKIVPENPIEFLRCVIYKTTNETLIIKNEATIELIKENNVNNDVVDIFARYNKKHNIRKLAEIFYRFKPLFLAFRKNDKLKPLINKIRRMAKTYHKPMPEDYLNEITAKIKKEEKIDVDKLTKELDRVNIFRKVRLLYALKFRTRNIDSVLYRVRNGKGFATTFGFRNKSTAKRILNIVLDSIIKDIKPNIKGKKIFIPDYITYTLPATEKQFTGDFPSGTYITIPKDMIFGIHWEDVDKHRIDIDLSLININEKIGWDTEYRNDVSSILFSGDITSAPLPKGATELFYVKRQSNGAHILFANYYNFDEVVEVPMKIIVAKEEVTDLKRNYMVDPNNVIAIAKTKINQKQKMLGLLITTKEECKFYFAETYLGLSISSSDKDYVENARKYLLDFYKNTITLNDILEKAGGKIVKDKEKCDIDLSPETLEKDTILRLIIKK